MASRNRSISGASVRRLLKKRKPSSDDDKIDVLSRPLDKLLRQGKTDPRKLQSLLKKVTGGARVLTLRRAGTRVPITQGLSLDHASGGCYLPGKAPPHWVPSEFRYRETFTWLGSSADTDVGRLVALQMLYFDRNQATSAAGLFGVLETTRATHGWKSRITVEPLVEWTTITRAEADGTWVYNATVHGTARFRHRIWVMALPGAQLFSAGEPVALRTIQVHSADWTLPTAGGLFGNKGTLAGSSAAIQFIASPPRTYLVGVVAEVQVTHDLRERGKPQPVQPAAKDFFAYGRLIADVPAICVSHEVLDYRGRPQTHL